MNGSSYLCLQITMGDENAVHLHVDIPRTGGRGSHLPFEAVLKEYLQFSYEYFPLVRGLLLYTLSFKQPP
jgi:hypothetical protein